MTHNTINSRQARENWSTLLREAQTGTRQVITISDIPVAAVVSMADLRRLEEPMATDPALDHLRTQGAAPQAIYQALLKVHHGDAKAAARQLIQHIRAEQEALLMLLDNGPSDH